MKWFYLVITLNTAAMVCFYIYQHQLETAVWAGITTVYSAAFTILRFKGEN